MSIEIEVTKEQNKYLLELKKGPKTTREMAEIIDVSLEAAGKMLKTLWRKGLTQKERMPVVGHVIKHRVSQEVMNADIKIVSMNEGGGAKRATEEEVRYAAILQNSGMTGRDRTMLFLKKFPNRKQSSAERMVARARREGLCR